MRKPRVSRPTRRTALLLGAAVVFAAAGAALAQNGRGGGPPEGGPPGQGGPPAGVSDGGPAGPGGGGGPPSWAGGGSPGPGAPEGGPPAVSAGAPPGASGGAPPGAGGDIPGRGNGPPAWAGAGAAGGGGGPPDAGGGPPAWAGGGPPGGSPAGGPPENGPPGLSAGGPPGLAAGPPGLAGNAPAGGRGGGGGPPSSAGASQGGGPPEGGPPGLAGGGPPGQLGGGAPGGGPPESGPPGLGGGQPPGLGGAEPPRGEPPGGGPSGEGPPGRDEDVAPGASGDAPGQLGAGPGQSEERGFGGVDRRGETNRSDRADEVQAAHEEARDAREDARAAREETRVAEIMSRPAQELPAVPSRSQQAQQLIRDYPRQIEADPAGEPIVRGQVLAIAPTPAALARARKAGFRVGESETYGGLGLQVMILTAPRGMPAAEAAERLRALDPEGQYEFNHLYQQGGATVLAARAAPAASLARVRPDHSVRVGLVDGAVAADQPTLAGAKVVQKAFVPGKSRPTAHATAVASLIAGAYGPFHGAAPGATLFVADIYGATPTGGSVEALVRALAWMAENQIPVINVSLVGPSNRLLAAAIQSLTARGHVVVAAVGNDGAAAGPLYPAAYPGVVAVTAVDARRRALPEAVRGPHVDFAAPGADMAAGGLAGFVKVRGTSFAAPVAAGRLAQMLRRPDPAAAARAVAALTRESTDLGVRGPDPVYGQGLVAFEVRTDPLAVGAQRTALQGR